MQPLDNGSAHRSVHIARPGGKEYGCRDKRGGKSSRKDGVSEPDKQSSPGFLRLESGQVPSLNSVDNCLDSGVHFTSLSVVDNHPMVRFGKLPRSGLVQRYYALLVTP